MLFEHNFIQNGDDCLTVGNNAKNIHFRYSPPSFSATRYSPVARDTYCEGGHGLSIGSLGKGGSVANVQDVVCVFLFLGELAFLTMTVVLKILLWFVRRYTNQFSRLTQCRGTHFTLHALRVGQAETVWPGSA